MCSLLLILNGVHKLTEIMPTHFGHTFHNPMDLFMSLAFQHPVEHLTCQHHPNIDDWLASPAAAKYVMICQQGCWPLCIIMGSSRWMALVTEIVVVAHDNLRGPLLAKAPFCLDIFPSIMSSNGSSPCSAFAAGTRTSQDYQ